MFLHRNFLYSFLVLQTHWKYRGSHSLDVAWKESILSILAEVFGCLLVYLGSSNYRHTLCLVFPVVAQYSIGKLLQMLGACPICAVEFRNWNVCPGLPHVNSKLLSYDVVIHAVCFLCLFPVLLGMQRQHWNKCKTSSETTLRGRIYWKCCLMRTWFMRNISKPNGKCMENSCNKVFSLNGKEN